MFKNYTYSLLSLKVDRRGFLVGQDGSASRYGRIGYTELNSSPSGLVDVLAGFTSITVGLVAEVEENTWLHQGVSTLTLTSDVASNFGTYDGEPIILAYNGTTLFYGYVDDSTLEGTIDPATKQETFQVTLTCRSFDAASYQLPPVVGAVTIFGTPENPGVSVVPGRGVETIAARAYGITSNGTTFLEDIFDGEGNSLLGERVGPLAPNSSGNQGAMLQDLADRAGLLVDLSKPQAGFRSYNSGNSQGRWTLTDSDLGNYRLSTDRDSPGALVLDKQEDSTQRIAYSATGANLVERTFSTNDSAGWGLATSASQMPLKKTADKYLTSFDLPYNPRVPLVSRLPIRVTFHHGMTTYRATVVQMTHTITPQRWDVSCSCAPVNLITRVGDLIPRVPRFYKNVNGSGQFTVYWLATSKLATATASGSTWTSGSFSGSTLVAGTSNTDIPQVRINDQVRVRKADGSLRDTRIATISSILSGVIYLDILLATNTAAGDYLEWVDFGVQPTFWRMYYRATVASQGVSPYDGLSAPSVATAYPTDNGVLVVPTGLVNYELTIYAYSAEGYRSGPSDTRSSSTG